MEGEQPNDQPPEVPAQQPQEPITPSQALLQEQQPAQAQDGPLIIMEKVVIVKEPCNPCCCVPVPIGALVLGLVFFIAVIEAVIVDFKVLPSARDCEIFRNDYKKDCHDFPGRLDAMKACITIRTVCWAIAGIALIVGAILKFHWAVLGASILSVISVLAYYGQLGLMGESAARFYHYFDYYDYLDADPKKELDFKDYIGMIVAVAVGIIVYAGVSIYLTVACFQYWKHIKAAKYKPLFGVKIDPKRLSIFSNKNKEEVPPPVAPDAGKKGAGDKTPTGSVRSKPSKTKA
jgi:hypothetical protein